MKAEDPYTINQNTRDKNAEKYQEKFMDLKLYDSSYDLFCNLLNRADAQILEIGCGPGNIAQYLLNKHPSLQVLATDVSPNMVHLAKKNNPKVVCRQLDARDIGKLDETFDGIVAGFILPYLLEQDGCQFIKDCAYILNPKGLLYLSFVAGDNIKSSYISGSSGDQMYFSYYSKERVFKTLQELGLEILEDISATFSKDIDKTEIHTIILARKN